MTLTDSRPARPTPTTGLPRLLAGSGEASPAAHLARLGPLPRTGPGLVAAVSDARLRGRGGAGFPTGRKMAAVAAARGPKTVVANGTEGEPLSRKDRTLLTTNPHLVLDGIVAAAGAVGADDAILCVGRGQASLTRLLGEAIAARADDLSIRVAESPDPYVAGQESALIAWLNGGDARPVVGRPPYVRGVHGRPTLVDNVETLAHVALIARLGREWFATLGTPDEPGSALVTVGGGVRHGGVYEIPVGMPLGDLLDEVGADPAGALLLGGYFGQWVDPRALRRAPLSHDGLAAHGAAFGAGVVMVVPADSCPLAEVAAVAGWYRANSAGQCGACHFGLADIAGAVDGLLAGTPGSEAAARRWTAMVRGRGACRFPDGAAAFVESALRTMADEIETHRHGGCRRPAGGHLPTPDPGAWR